MWRDAQLSTRLGGCAFVMAEEDQTVRPDLRDTSVPLCLRVDNDRAAHVLHVVD